MSNIGLNTNLFRITGKYLDILNEFVVRAKIHSDVGDNKREQLVEFINKLNDIENTQPQYQLLSSIIDRKLRLYKKPSTYLQTLVKELEENHVDEALPKIEFIVSALDTENSEALLKIKGD